MDRRNLLQSTLALPFVLTTRARAQEPIYIGDMHFHSFFGESKYHARPLATSLSQGKASLVAWSIVGDLLWTETTPRGIVQKGVPATGEALGWFQREAGRVKAHATDQGLKLVRTPADVDLAVKGQPHIVLAVEGASFIDKPEHVKTAYGLGVRHLQLVHYVRNPIGDFQTEKPEHNGLTTLGRQVVEECNRLGILIDLAHCTPAAIRAALAISKVPMVWSHNSIAPAGSTPSFSMVGWRARRLTLSDAKAIADKGGVVGLWAVKFDVGETTEAYAQRMLALAAQLGDDHVAFGTDINGLGTYAMMSSYADVRRVVEHWQREKIAEPRIRKLAIENYARVLKSALIPVRT